MRHSAAGMGIKEMSDDFVFPPPPLEPRYKRWYAALGLTFKDWVTIGLATCALAVSGATACYTLWEYSDVKATIVGRSMSMRVAEMGPDFEYQRSVEPRREFRISNSEISLMFANSGNRSVVIAETYLIVSRPKNEERECLGDTFRFDYHMDPVVLKAGDVAIQQAKRDSRPYLIVDVQPKGTEHFVVCAVVTAASTNKIATTQVPLARHVFSHEKKEGKTTLFNNGLISILKN